MTKLKPCPFCGGEAKIYGTHEGGMPWVACKSCIGQTTCHETEEKAIEAWNGRVGENDTEKE